MEFLHSAVYPGVGGLSGIFSRNIPRAALNEVSSLMEFTDFGSRFQDFEALTENEFSNRDLTDRGQFLGIGGTLALMPSRSNE